MSTFIAPIAITLFSCAIQVPDIAGGPFGTHYVVRATDAHGDGRRIPLDVTMRIAHPPRGRVVVQIPLWTPGSYRLRDFPEAISDVRARHDDGRALDVTRLERSAWEVACGDADTIVVEYRVALAPDDRFMQRGDSRRCLTYEGPQVYMFVRGHTRIPSTVEFDLPAGWRAASGLIERGDGTWFAESYDFLADCPVKLGEFQSFRFDSHGRPIDVVVDAPGELAFDHTAWLANLKRITDCQGEMFGGFPFDRYVFLFTASPRGGGGGLEHLTSTAIGISANQLARDPRTGIGVVAHEFFHLWNVKRLRPVELGPFDYSRPVRTTALWLMEGVTSYYTSVTLVRCGLSDEQSFWRGMIDQIRRLENNPAREHVSSADASFRVWDDQASDRRLDYYNSGLVLGLLLDVEVRAATDNQRCLDDVMRALFDRCRTDGRGYDEPVVAATVGAIAGRDFTAWFDRHVSGTVAPRYEEILALAGVSVTARRTRATVIRGLSDLRRTGGDVVTHYSDPDVPRAVLARNGMGRVVAADGAPVASSEDLLARVSAEREVVLELEQPSGGRIELRVRPVTVPRFEVDWRFDDAASGTALAIRRGIVTGTPKRPGALSPQRGER